MQSLEARTNYRNTFHCAYRILTEDGVTRFWAGTTPRLVRLVVSQIVYNLESMDSLYTYSLPEVFNLVRMSL